MDRLTPTIGFLCREDDGTAERLPSSAFRGGRQLAGSVLVFCGLCCGKPATPVEEGLTQPQVSAEAEASAQSAKLSYLAVPGLKRR